MTLTIENVKPEFLPKFKEFAQSLNATITEKMDEIEDECPICKAYNYTPNSKEMREALKESEEIAKNPHLYPSFKNAKELLEDCLK